MVRVVSGGVTLPRRRLMIFIDGGYLRNGLEKLFDNDKINFAKLRNYIVTVTATQGIRPELIRAYYYDGIVNPLDDREKYKEQEAYFKKIRSRKLYELRLGRLIESKGEYRQKGVDILIAVDMLSKSYLGHYDIAAFLGGDDDFLDLISAVKNLTGRRVHGFYFSHNVSKRLADCFDIESKLTKTKSQPLMRTT